MSNGNSEDVAAYQAYRKAKEREQRKRAEEAAQREQASNDAALENLYGAANSDGPSIQEAAFTDTVATIRDIKGDGGDEGALLYIATTSTVREACEFLAERRIGLVLVCDAEGTLAGVLSERDVVRAIAAHGSDALRASVDNFITRDVFTCSSSDKVSAVARIMSERRFRHAPIVDDGMLMGMVSATDIVNFFAKQQG